jgi:hypothetical protein
VVKSLVLWNRERQVPIAALIPCLLLPIISSTLYLVSDSCVFLPVDEGLMLLSFIRVLES